MKINKIFVLVFVLILGTFNAEVQGSKGEVEFLNGASSVRIKISLFDNVVYIPVSVNGSNAVDFVLDTGAMGISIVDSSVIEGLNIKKEGETNISGAGANSARLTILKNLDLSIRDIAINGMSTGSMSFDYMELYWGKPKYGLLGGNILEQLVTEIDYENRYVTFFKPADYKYNGEGVRIPVKIAYGGVILESNIKIGPGEKKIRGKFIVDTGVRNSFFNSYFNKVNKIIEKSGTKLENITGFGIGGPGFGIMSRIGSIEIGPYSITGALIELTTDTKGFAASKRVDGIIGADILSRFKVIFDYSRSEMILEPNKKFGTPFVYDMSGIYFIQSKTYKGSYEAAYVVKNSPADRIGIKKGDILTGVDGIPADKFNYEQIKAYFKRADKIVRITILRKNKELEFVIKLEELL